MANMKRVGSSGKVYFENVVFEWLKAHLDDKWTVFANVHFPNDAGEFSNEKDRPDIDFIACHPAHGLIVIEAKGSRVSGLPDNPVTEGGYDIKPQLAGQRAMIQQYFKAAGIQMKPEDLPVILVIDPKNKERPSGLITNMPGHASWICTAEPAVLAQHVANAKFKRKDWTDQATDMLMHNFHADSTKLKLAPFEARTQSERKALTQDMQVPVKAISDYKAFIHAREQHRIVEGVAGTGKTQVIVEEVRTLSSEGRKVLLACWNVHLMQSLQNRFPGPDKSVRVMTADDILKAFAIANQIKLPDESDEAYYDELSGAIHETSDLDVPASLKKIDFVVVDESQDLMAENWKSLAAIKNDKKRPRFLISHDTTQQWRTGVPGIDDIKNLIPGDWQYFQLTNNLRNLSSIRDLARRYLTKLIGKDQAEQAMPNFNRGNWPGHASEATIKREEVTYKLAQALDKIKNQHSPGGIMVLTSDSATKLQDRSRNPQGIMDIAVFEQQLPLIFPTLSIMTVPEIQANKTLLDTILRTKGLESDAVIAFIEKRSTSETDPTKKAKLEHEEFRRAYIAATRAKRHLQLFWVTP